MTDLGTRQLTAADVDRITSAQREVDQDAIVVRPHRDNSGILGMDEVLRSLPRADTETGGLLRRRERNTSAPFAFEMRYAADPAAGTGDERVLSLQYVGGDERMSSLLGRQLPDKYPDSRTEQRPATWLSPEPSQHIAAATLGLRRYSLYPLKNVELDEFRSDPTGSILTEMVGAADAGGVDADVTVQVMARPAGTDWMAGVRDGYGLADTYGAGLTTTEDKVTSALSTQKLRWFLNQPTHERRAILPSPIGSALGLAHPAFRDEFEHPPSKADKQAAKMLSDLDGRGWEFHIRIVAVSNDADLARERVASTAEMFDNFYEYRGAQTFVPVPQNGDAAIDTATAAAGRDWPTKPEQRMIKPQIEVAGLVNIPEAEHVTTNKLRWALASPGEGIPPGTARFDFDTHGLDAATAAREDAQVAMLESAGRDEPLWYGTGVKYGTEAGVFPDALYHQFVGGATRQGKTTLLTNFSAQCFRGDGAGLIIDPKGLDADEFIAEWPKHRDPEDLIVMDLSDEFDRIPRFNFLEIPEYLEAGTRAHTSYCEALAEDILAMVAEAGGSDNYLGALMKRVVKTVVRGLAKTGETATLLDVAAVCASSDNLSRFRQQMADERFEFLRETAERLEERDDTDLEPLAGRMDEWVLNDNVRELICARDSSFSINDVIEDGGWLVVRFDKASSEAGVTMVGTALIRRTYFAQRHFNPDCSFDLVCDEFDNIATEESNIHKILSEAAAFNYRCTLACQAPTNQLPERVRHAIENQCGTFLSFNPGGGKDAGWISQQHTVDKEDLLNLSRFQFYMRATTRDDDLTHSYMVEGFPPAREARGEPRTDAEIRALKEASLDEYGSPVESAAEQRAASPFIGGGFDSGGLDVTDDVERAVVQGVYDTAVRAGDSEAHVALDEAAPSIRRRIADVADMGDRLDDIDDLWRRVVQHVGDDVLDVQERNGETTLRAVKPRATIATVGTDKSAGGAGHASLMWDAYDPLTWAGLDVTINDASGDDADALARPTPVAEQNAPELVDRLTGGGEARVESESSTGRTKAGVTAQHVLQAANEGRQAIVLSRPDDVDNVADTLREPPAFCRSDHAVDGETRFYTSPRDVRIGGEKMTRPGGRENVWVEDDETGEIVLRDDEGAEYARFDTPGAVFSRSELYPSGGENTVKRPIIPEELVDEGADPHAEILTVPEDSESLSDLSLVVDVGLAVPAGSVGEGDLVPTEELDVPDNAIHLLEALREIDESPVTVSDATDHVDVSRRSVRNYLGTLAEQGALRREEGDHAAAPDRYHLR